MHSNPRQFGSRGNRAGRVAQVARELGISDNVLYRWRTEQRQVDSLGRTRQAVRTEQDELTRLKRDNETLRKERDVSQRAAACFVRESP